MATRARNNTRTSRGATRAGSYGVGSDTGAGSRDETRGGNSGGMRSLAKGIHVTAEMPDPKVARITIDIEWANLVARVAQKVGRRIKRRAAGQSRRASGTRRARAR